MGESRNQTQVNAMYKWKANQVSQPLLIALFNSNTNNIAKKKKCSAVISNEMCSFSYIVMRMSSLNLIFHLSRSTMISHHYTVIYFFALTFLFNQIIEEKIYFFFSLHFFPFLFIFFSFIYSPHHVTFFLLVLLFVIF